MPPELSTSELLEFLVAFLVWLSVFVVGLVSLVVLVLLSASVYELAKGRGRLPRSLLSAAFLAALFAHHAREESLKIPLGLDLYLPVPESNPVSADKVSLGRRLFFDRRLSLMKASPVTFPRSSTAAPPTGESTGHCRTFSPPRASNAAAS